MLITTNVEDFDHYQVAVSYLAKIAKEELIGSVAKIVRKESRKIAEDLIEKLYINVIIKDNPSSLEQTVAVRVNKK